MAKPLELASTGHDHETKTFEFTKDEISILKAGLAAVSARGPVAAKMLFELNEKLGPDEPKE